MVKCCNENAIREAAYFIWQNSGCPSGQDEQIWAMAVEQLSKNSNKNSCCKTTAKKTSTSSKKASASSSKSKTSSAKKSSK